MGRNAWGCSVGLGFGTQSWQRPQVLGESPGPCWLLRILFSGQCEALEGSEQDSDWTWLTFKENSLGPRPSVLIVAGQAWKQRHQESHSVRCWQQQRWRERDKFNRHFCSQNGRTCWWISVGRKRTREPPSLPSSLGGWVRLEPWSAGAWEAVQMAVTLEARERTDFVQHSGNMPEMSKTQSSSASRLKPNPASDPAILDLSCLLRSSSLTLWSLYKKCQPRIAHVLAWWHRSHRDVKWKLWSSTVSGWQCVSMGVDGNERWWGAWWDRGHGGGKKVWKRRKEGYGESGAARAKAATPHGWDQWAETKELWY